MSGKRLVWMLSMAAAAGLLTQCSESTEPEPPATIVVESGDNQTSLRGTEVERPLEVRVKTKGGGVPKDAVVNFSVTQGGGSVSPSRLSVNERGLASTRLMLGPTLGTNKVQASVEGAGGLSVTFMATSSSFYCEEANDTLRVGTCGTCTSSYGPRDDIFLFTTRSSLHGPLSGGIVEANITSQTAMNFVEIEPDLGFFPPVVFDAALSPRGDYYIARRTTQPEILKVGIGGGIAHFASLDQTGVDDKVEITTYSHGLLAGCDIKGPFVVGCRDTLMRFDEASYVMGGINNDAVAADPRRQDSDPLGEDIYFISRTDRTLMRLAVDSLRVETRGLEIVAPLTQDEADGANGMVCDGFDGNVYILVDTPNTKEILQVTSAGAVTTLFDFTSRGAGDAAGIQNDLALRRPFLFTLDTLNDKLLVYDLADTFTPLFSDSLEQSKLSSRDGSGNLSGGERVGLAVLK